MTGRIWPVAVAATVGIALLLALGGWQLQRLSWKQGLLAAVDERLAGSPGDLASILAATESGDDIEFRKVRLVGRFLQADEKLMLNTLDGKIGWEVVTPLVTGSGVAVLVDRGFIPDEIRDPAKRMPLETTDITGIVRRHGSARGLFDPDNDVAGNMWYWWDLPAMLAASAIPADTKVAPFVVQALPTEPSAIPRPAEPRAVFRNNHLQYAITWFGLAIVLAVVAFFFARQQRA